MDPNLVKIKNSNMRLIRKGKFRLPLLQARHYLTYILTEEKQEQIDLEMREFENHIKRLEKRDGQVQQKHRNQEGQSQQRSASSTSCA